MPAAIRKDTSPGTRWMSENRLPRTGASTPKPRCPKAKATRETKRGKEFKAAIRSCDRFAAL